MVSLRRFWAVFFRMGLGAAVLRFRSVREGRDVIEFFVREE